MEYIKNIFFQEPLDINDIPISHNLIKDISIQFNLPIHFINNDSKFEIKDTTKNDINLQDVYKKLFCSENDIDDLLIEKWGTYTTHDKQFLKDTQHIVKNMNCFKEKFSINDDSSCNINTINKFWIDIDNPHFCNKYSFMEWDIFESFNHSTAFLTFITLSNIFSPMFFFILPFIFLAFPFVLLKIQRAPITLDKYLSLLKVVAKNHFIGKALLKFENLSLSSVVQIIFYIFMFIMQIYNNIQYCKKYYNDLINVNENIIMLQNHIHCTTNMMNDYKSITVDCQSYNGFISQLNKQQLVLEQLYNEIENIQYIKPSFTTVFQYGKVLKYYYSIYKNKAYKNALCYSFGFNTYIQQLYKIHENVSNGIVKFSTFTNKKTKIYKQTYPLIVSDTKPVDNDCNLSKNVIITGVNASGKTTVLKTTTINIIISQQIGCGFYGKCVLNPYTHVHTYLNIPDTSQRDSLFQAESRRCKEIIDIINDTDENTRHFCIFDELYSGTNPHEASSSAIAFLTYLNKFNNIDYLLTTHYVKICNKFKKNSRVSNYKMFAELDNSGNCIYHYKMMKGISTIKGALNILKQLEYPDDIINNIDK